MDEATKRLPKLKKLDGKDSALSWMCSFCEHESLAMFCCYKMSIELRATGDTDTYLITHICLSQCQRHKRQYSKQLCS